jgi:hypothetical protein
MLVAVLLALATTTQADAPAQEPLPQIADIRIALISHWIQISSSGYALHDYAVRNIDCTPVPLSKEYQSAETDNKLILTDSGVLQARCSYDYAPLPMRQVHFDTIPVLKETPKPLSEKQLRRIPEERWTRQERQFVRFARRMCMMMSRTPLPGECDDYWAIIL